MRARRINVIASKVVEDKMPPLIDDYYHIVGCVREISFSSSRFIIKLTPSDDFLSGSSVTPNCGKLVLTNKRETEAELKELNTEFLVDDGLLNVDILYALKRDRVKVRVFVSRIGLDYKVQRIEII